MIASNLLRTQPRSSAPRATHGRNPPDSSASARERLGKPVSQIGKRAEFAVGVAPSPARRVLPIDPATQAFACSFNRGSVHLL